MQYPLPELIDRLSIERLKEERIPNYKSEWPLESVDYSDYGIQSSLVILAIGGYLSRLHFWNGKIWDLESDIRKGKEGELGLEEVGRRAIQIREFNNERIGIKNEIAECLGGFKEVKHDHASE